MKPRSQFRTIGTFLILTFAALVISTPAWAEVRSATVEVDGMACPFCAFGVEKRLRKVDGVGSVEISTSKGTATLNAKEGESIDVRQIPGAIEKAGFQGGPIDVEVIGRLSTGTNDRLRLQVSGTDQVVAIAETTGGTAAELRTLASKQALVRVTGTVVENGRSLTISPRTVDERTR